MEQVFCRAAICGLFSGFVATILVFGKTDESTHVDMTFDASSAVLLFGAELEPVEAEGLERPNWAVSDPDAGSICIRF
jgi:hypothetical protein